MREIEWGKRKTSERDELEKQLLKWKHSLPSIKWSSVRNELERKLSSLWFIRGTLLPLRATSLRGRRWRNASSRRPLLRLRASKKRCYLWQRGHGCGFSAGFKGSMWSRLCRSGGLAFRQGRAALINPQRSNALPPVQREILMCRQNHQRGKKNPKKQKNGAITSAPRRVHLMSR